MSGTNSEEDLKVVLSITQGQVHQISELSDIAMIKLALQAFNGEHCLSLFVDSLLFNNQKSTSQFLVSLAT